MMMDGAYFEIDAFHAAKGALDARQPLIGAHRYLGIKRLFDRQAGVDEVEPVEGGLFMNLSGFAPPADKACVADFEFECLAIL